MKKISTQNSKPRTIYIVGPTASGKTALAIVLSKEMDAEIICADSQTIRRELNIGTAKPSHAEMQGIKHHMLDIIGPYDEYSLALFQKEATSTIDLIHAQGKTAIIVGGTGLYVDALYFNFRLPRLSIKTQKTEKTPNLKQHSPFSARSHPVAGCDLAEIAETANKLAGLSVEELQGLIAERGLALPNNQNNPRHLINVLLRDGSVGMRHEPSNGSVIVGISPNREVLISRINDRVEMMFVNGLVDEVSAIIQKHGRPPKSFDAIGYKIVLRMLDGEITEAEAKELFKIADRQYAKRQMSWFKRNKDIVWFESPQMAKDYILNL